MLELKEYLNLIKGTYLYNLMIRLNVNLPCYMLIRQKQ